MSTLNVKFIKIIKKCRKGIFCIPLRLFILFYSLSSETSAEAFSTVGGMFGAGSIPFISKGFIYNLRSYGLILVISMLASTPLFVKITEKLSSNRKAKTVIDILEIPVLLILLFIVTSYLADGSFNPFLYFRF